jgi:uncharacterized repeat protein (TIGR01451 family)
MKIFSGLRMFALLAFGLVVAGSRLAAQGIGLSITSSTNVIAVSNSLTYTINLTNLTAESFVVFVTNTFPAGAQFLGASINPGSATMVTNANGFSFNNIPLNPVDTIPFIQTMTVMAEPTQTGLFTNTVVVAISGVTNFTAYLVTQVTNAPVLPQADLAVAITGPPSAVFTNDWMVYGVSVTNLGPSTAPGVFLTNTLPAGVVYKSVSPSNLVHSISLQGSNVIFNLGTLASGAFTNLQLTVQLTNAIALTFSSFVNSTSVTDTNLANNTATTNITVGSFIYGQLIATNVNVPQMTYDPQIGLMTNIIRLTNTGTNVVAGARVIVSGLTNWLYNAVGTNSGNPYVVYNGQLNPNQAVDLVLDFFVPTRLPITVTNYTAVITQTLMLSNNIPPVLLVIPTNYVDELTLLTVANSATNPNPNATILGYGLISSPTNMSISTNGIIIWTPVQTQSPSTNTITTVVTNSDPFDLVNSNLMATNSFTVIVREVNTAPALPTILTQMVNEQTLLTVTNTATNSNIHAGILGYGLVNSPTNMFISTNGIITWTPIRNQSPSTNKITTVVTNSDPFDLVNTQLTATNNFTVIVIPFVLTGPTRLANGDFQFVFSTGAGVNYTIQYSTNLTDWISIISFPGPGGWFTNRDPNAATSPWRFYRVLLNQ